LAVIRSVIRSCGAYLPARVVTNRELAETVDTSDAWIKERTGISTRHIAAEGELTSDLGAHAAKQALVRAGVDASEVDLIVCATSTPDLTFPASAVAIQAKLGVKPGAAAFDIQAVCSGFVYAMAVADGLLKGGPYKRALVIGAETFSRIIDWTDRTTCVLFGDGAGAIVLTREKSRGGTDERGVLSTHIHSDGRLYDLLYVDGGPSSTK
jgi:3-oxoacyl-[acyl-carrier-protein] synthase-3